MCPQYGCRGRVKTGKRSQPLRENDVVSNTLLRILGFNISRVPEDAERAFTWTNPAHSWGVVVLLIAVGMAIYIVTWLYCRELETCPRSVRYALAAIRVTVVLLLVVVLLGPAIAITQRRTVQPYVVVLVDDSISMAQPDRYIDLETAADVSELTGSSVEAIQAEQPDRMTLVRTLLKKDDREFVRSLTAKGNLMVRKFSSSSTLQSPTTRRPDEDSLTAGVGKGDDALAWVTATRPQWLLILAGVALGAWVLGNLASLRRMAGWTVESKMGWGLLNVVILVAAFVLYGGPRAWGDSPSNESVASGEEDGDDDGGEAADDDEPNLISDEEIDAFFAKTTGRNTNISKALKDAANAAHGSRLAAIVLISDGQHNVPDDQPVDSLPTGVPVFTIGLGDPSSPRNLEVVRLLANDQVVKDDPFEIGVTVRAIGRESTDPVEVVLYREKAGGDSEEPTLERIESRSVSFPAGGGEKSVEPFKVKESNPGHYTYRIVITPVENETDENDNSKTVNITVLNDKARVLLISGGPSWDYRMVQSLLTNDDRFDLSCWLQSMDIKMQQKGNTPIRKLPFKPEDLAQYHVIMMFDPNPMEFDEAWIDALSQWANKHGGGLLFVAGPQYTDRFVSGPRTRAIRKLLPVYVADTDSLDAQLISTRTHPWPLRIEPANADHAIMRFSAEDDADIDVWNQMPGVYWSFPAESAKPGSRVLIEHGDPNLRVGQYHRPLLAINKLGAGRTVYLGFNGTWRWRRMFGAEYFRRFWIQMTKYLVEGRNLRGKNRVILDVDRRAYDIGDTVNVFARLLKPNFEPLDTPQVTATLRGGTLPPAELQLTMVEPGEYKGSITDIARLGVNRLSLPLDGSSSEMIATTFTVKLPAIEKKDLRLNRPLLEELADKSDGGQYFVLSDVSEIAELIPDREKTTLVPGRPVELWDTHVLMFLLAGLLSVEWIVRKRFKLA